MSNSQNEKGFTFIEIIIACLILAFLVMAVLQYHQSSGASKNQKYFLKAVETAGSEMEKLRACYSTDSGVAEFEHTGPPPQQIFLFKYGGTTTKDEKTNHRLAIPNPLFRIYTPEGCAEKLFGKVCLPNDETCSSGVSEFQRGFCEGDGDKMATYFFDDGDPAVNYIDEHEEIRGLRIDSAVAVIDDMGSPSDCDDDLLGNIGWWVEDAGFISGVTPHLKKITFVLQFWYPGQAWYEVDPEVIVLKTTLVEQ